MMSDQPTPDQQSGPEATLLNIPTPPPGTLGDFNEPPPKKKRRSQNPLPMWLGIAGAVICLLAVIGAGVYWFTRNGQLGSGGGGSVSGLAALALETQRDQPEVSVPLAMAALKGAPGSAANERILGELVFDHHLASVIPLSPEAVVLSVSWNADGSGILTAATDGVVRLWDTQSHAEIRNKPFDSAAALSAAAISPDGNRVAVGVGGDAQIWDIAFGTQLAGADGPDSRITTIAWNPNQTQFATASADGALRVWDATTGAMGSEYQGAAGVPVMVWNLEGTRLYEAGSDGRIYEIDAKSGRIYRQVSSHETSVLDIALSPDGLKLATAGSDGRVKVWNLQTGRIDLTLSNHAGAASGVRFSLDGSMISTVSSADGLTHVWDSASGAPIMTVMGSGKDWQPGSTRFATLSGSTLRLWDTANPALKSLPGHAARINGTGWNPEGTLAVTASSDGTAAVWDIASGQQIVSFAEHKAPVSAVAWRPGAAQVGSIGGDGQIRLWDSQTGAMLIAIQTNNPQLRALDWSPDGSHIATAGGDTNPEIWDATSAAMVFALTGHTQPVEDIQWSPDGKQVATASGDNSIGLWDAQTGQIIRTLTDPRLYQPHSVDWSADGSRLLTAGENGMVMLWDARAGTASSALWIGDPLLSAAWSPSGARILVITRSLSVQVWTLDGGKIVSLPGVSAAWSADGKHLLVGGINGSVTVWQAWQSAEELLGFAQSCCVVQELTPEQKAKFGVK